MGASLAHGEPFLILGRAWLGTLQPHPAEEGVLETLRMCRSRDAGAMHRGGPLSCTARRLGVVVLALFTIVMGSVCSQLGVVLE